MCTTVIADPMLLMMMMFHGVIEERQIFFFLQHNSRGRRVIPNAVVFLLKIWSRRWVIVYWLYKLISFFSVISLKENTD